MSEAYSSPNGDDPYYTEKVWFGSQPESGGLTQAELDDLAYACRTKLELEEHQAFTERELKRLDFLRWCQDRGIGCEGAPDGSMVLRPRLVHKPIPHKEWRLMEQSGNVTEVSEPIEPSDDDLPPAA